MAIYSMRSRHVACKSANAVQRPSLLCILNQVSKPISQTERIDLVNWPHLRFVYGVVIALLAMQSLAAADDAVSSQPNVDYIRDVQPVLERHCVKCHGPQKQESGFRVDVRATLLSGGDFGEPAVVPGDSRTSHLIAYVEGDDADIVMPPKGDRLAKNEIATLRAWIDDGLKMPTASDVDVKRKTDHWSFQPIRRPPPPTVNTPRAINAVDAFVISKLQTAGLELSPPADRRALIRRVYLDVLGLLPSPERVEAFVGDLRPDAYERLVDEVLASPNYGEHWARHWLDVVRFADSNGFETNKERPTAWRYRDWVIQALNDDKPYDRFVAEQLAGDALGADAATGFIVGGPTDVVKSPDPVLTAMQRQDEMADMINTTGTAFLGLTIGCARCHNHKFDPVLQSDYYSMQAVFAGVQHGERDLRPADYDQRQQQAKQLAARTAAINGQLRQLVDSAAVAETPLRPAVNSRENVESFSPVLAKRVRFTVLATNNGIQPCIDELEIWSTAAAAAESANVALASVGATASSSGNYPGDPHHKLEHINDGRYGNSYSWISNENGKGWVQIELPQATTIDRITWGRDREERYKDRTAIQYKIEVAVDADDWLTVASSDDRVPSGSGADPLAAALAKLSGEPARQARALGDEKKRLEARRQELLAMPKAYAGVFRQPGPTFRLYRGDPMSPREQVAPDAVTIIGSLDLPADAREQDRRVALANWIVAPDNPLTARVIVNRIWHYHFGRGIVATPSDFGAMGAPPTHPELLDWLADELQHRAGWSLKHIHRLILLSATYRQSSRPTPRGMQVDANSELLWRFPPRRLEAESIRDNVLLVSGALDRQMGGPGFMMFHPNSNYSRNWVAKDDFGPAEFRRMIYALKLRMEQDAVFGAFDCPDAGQVAPRRSQSTTPIQSLNLLNSNFILQQAGRLADRVRGEAGDDSARQIERVFQLAFLRKPDAEESAAAVQLVNQHGLTALCRAIYNANEFLFIR